MQRARFLVVGMQRSGTTVTHAILAGHPQVSVHDQELHASLFRAAPIAACGATGRGAVGETAAARREAFIALFDALTAREAGPEVRAAGLKTAIEGHDDAVAVAAFVRDYLPGLRVILVRRDDLVAQLGSLRRAQVSGRWHSTDAGGGAAPASVRLDPAEVRAYAADARRAVAHLRTLADSHELLELVYERDIEAGDPAGRLFGFVGVDVVPASWLRMRKVSPDPAAYIEDYAALRREVDALSAPDPGAERALAAERELAGPPDSPLLHLHRAVLAVENGRPREAHDRVLAAIAAGLDDMAPSRWAFEVLEDAWRALGDEALARRTLDALADAHGDDPHYRFLCAVVQRHGGDDEGARATLRGVLAAARGHERAIALLRELGG